MGTAFALAPLARGTGVVAVALLAALVALAPTVRARALAMLAALALTPVLLVAEIWESPQLRPLRDRPVLALTLVVGGLLALAELAAVLDRRPALLALLATAAIPFRIPIAAGGTTSNLLVPLYLVVAAGGLAFAARRLRRPAHERAPAADGVLEPLLLGAVVLYALQATYSTDLGRALQNVVFFYVPFALLLALLREVPWTRRLVLGCFGVLVALALVFVAIGYVEYGSRELLLNPKVINANEFEPYFRVNSLFFDPNIYGRFLMIAMVALAAAMIWATRRRDVLLATAALAVLWGGLVLSFSQSSFGALLVGLAVLAALRWNPRMVLGLAGAGLAIGVAFVIAFPGAVRLDLASSTSVDKATSGRVNLIEGGLQLFGDRPVWGWGAGAFAHEFRAQRKASTERAVSASHTIPVTVAAEQGAIGLLVYLALVIVALVRLLRGARGDVVRAAFAAAFAALVFHTLLYAAFLEDPLAWALLAVGLAWPATVAAAPAERVAVAAAGS